MLVRLAIGLALLAMLISPLAPLHAQDAVDPTAGQSETDETAIDGSEDAEGNDPDDPSGGGASRISRSPQSAAPVASEEWAKASFVGFIDIRQRLSQPDQDLIDKGVRLLTTSDFPPFNSRDDDGTPQGYNVELARALCEELNIACTLKIAPFAQIPDLLANGDADAALAGLSNHPGLQDKLGFSNIYLQRPARFARLKAQLLRISAHELDGKPVAVRGGSAHEAYLKAYFPALNRVPVTDMEDARQLLIDSKVVAIFGDAFNLLPLIAEADSPIIFAGKPFYDARFFGDGMAIAYGRDQLGLKNLFNYGLLKLAQKGRMSELYARHFALDVYTSY